MIKFHKRKTFYPFPVYEWNLPAGHSCPFAKDCLVKADRITGKQITIGGEYKCYAAVTERYPSVRKSRWDNFDAMLAGEPIVLPKDATHVRIHGSGDFYSQAYFDKWLDVCRTNPNVKFWAFTKSIEYWVNRISEIPPNLTLQASYGSKQDKLIEAYNLKYAKVFNFIEDVPKDLPIDTDDSLAMSGTQSFALLNNFKYKKGKQHD